MKHAGEMALDRLENVLAELRKFKMLKEKKRGVFYRQSSAFLHFHEDAGGLFADVRSGADWQRLPATTKSDRRALLTRVRTLLRECGC